MKRIRLNDSAGKSRPNFFARRNENIKTFSTGCKLLDCVIGGGWALGRVGNVVGDKSTGKTLLMIEAAVNFMRAFPDGHVYYRETEAAFDESYAEALGLPLDYVDFGDDSLATVEAFDADLEKVIARVEKSKEPALYILDSLDALSDLGELERDMNKGSYGAEKAKKMSQLFRKRTSQIEKLSMSLLIVSQVRDKIGITFGRQHTRSGGRALDFYCSQVVWLNHMKTIKRQYQGIERATGVRIRAKCEKNKVALPFRECEFEIQFGFGVGDVEACMTWLNDVKKLDFLMGGKPSSFLRELDRLGPEDYQQAIEDLHEAVEKAWVEIETDFLPKRKKYV